MMRLEHFMNNHYDDWRQILSAPPYNLKISNMNTQCGTYVILKYNQLSSDFNDPLVREARGSIFFQDHLSGLWTRVCHPFDKFGNYGESYVPHINWSTARVYEKVDGSLIKMWYHGGWHISTNGTIDACYAQSQDGETSYYKLVLRALREHGDADKFFQSLNTEITYMFELVSPDNRMTVPYNETRLYLIGARDNESDEELDPDWVFLTIDSGAPGMIKLPKSYPLQTLEDCIAAAEAMGCDEEGFVVCDHKFNRVKVKSPAYLYASHLRFNNCITTKKVIKIIREGILDDFVSYNADYKEKVDLVMQAGRVLAVAMEEAWAAHSWCLPETKRDYFEMVRESRYRDFYCKKYDGKFEITALDWLNKQSIDTIAEWIDEEITNLLGIEEENEDAV